MFIYFSEYETEIDIDTEICIIGAGAAGITLATSFLSTDIDVCVLESGGFDFDKEVQLLYSGENTGLITSPLGCRLRYFGGSTNHWAGYCTRLRDIDFTKRIWITGSGWPISLRELESYYEKAHQLCDIGPYRYQREYYESKDAPFPKLDKAKLKFDFWQFSPPTRFGEKYKPELGDAKNIRVFLNCSVSTLISNGSASLVENVIVRHQSGAHAQVRAKIFVLACGGIENARLLLLSNGIQVEGLGNGNGLVGRYFMQNVAFRQAGEILTDNPLRVLKLFGKRQVDETETKTGLMISHRAQEENQLLNCGFTINAVSQQNGYFELKRLWHQFKQGKVPEDLDGKIWDIVKDLDSVIEGLYSRTVGTEYLGDVTGLLIHARCEQLPNSESRVSLSEKLDALGVPTVKVDWRLSPLERRTLRTGLQLMGEEFGRLGLGRVKISEFLQHDRHPWPEPIWSGCHHKGTTRMSATAEKGVVNSDCRMHTVNNLYVAGSSVFPTASYVTPTLTIVALALRLAEHLKQKIHDF